MSVRIERTSQRSWKITNDEHESEHIVVFRTRFECDCIGFIHNKRCYHVDAVIGSLQES